MLWSDDTTLMEAITIISHKHKSIFFSELGGGGPMECVLGKWSLVENRFQLSLNPINSHRIC